MSVMSVDVGLSAEQEDAALMASFKNKIYREIIRQELIDAFSDSSLSWAHLLDNENYCVFSADSEEEAMEYVRRRLWAKLD